MDVDPELFVGVIPNALVLLVQAVKCATNDIVLGLCGRTVKLDPLALLDELKDVGACPDSIW